MEDPSSCLAELRTRERIYIIMPSLPPRSTPSIVLHGRRSRDAAAAVVDLATDHNFRSLLFLVRTTFVLLLCGSSYLAGSMFGHNRLGNAKHGEGVGVGRLMMMRDGNGNDVRGGGEGGGDTDDEVAAAALRRCDITREKLIEMHVRRGLDEQRRRGEEEEDDDDTGEGGGRGTTTTTTTATGKRRRFPSSTMGKSINGLVRVTKDGINDLYDFGNPVDIGHGTTVEDALLFYQKREAYPTSDESLRRDVEYDEYDGGNGGGGGGGGGIPIADASIATENCDTMNVILTNNPGNTRQCTAMIGNFESYHVQRWMKVDTVRSTTIDPTLPLVLVSRGYAQIGHGPKTRGKANFIAPPMDGKGSHVMKHWNRLLSFFANVYAILEDLGDVLERISRNNAVVILTCNMGQSALLMNFACNARRRGFDLGNVLVFPSDVETRDLAEGLGLTTYYDEKVR